MGHRHPGPTPRQYPSPARHAGPGQVSWPCAACRGVQVPPELSRPFPASCSGSAWGVGPAGSFTQSRLCLSSQASLPQAWEVQETFPPVVTPEPVGLNSKCERWAQGCRGGPPRWNSWVPGNNLGCSLEAIYVRHWVDLLAENTDPLTSSVCGEPGPWPSAALGAALAGSAGGSPSLC